VAGADALDGWAAEVTFGQPTTVVFAEDILSGPMDVHGVTAAVVPGGRGASGNVVLRRSNKSDAGWVGYVGRYVSGHPNATAPVTCDSMHLQSPYIAAHRPRIGLRCLHMHSATVRLAVRVERSM